MRPADSPGAPNLDARRIPAATLHRAALAKLAGMPSSTPTVAELAEALGWSVRRTRDLIGRMEFRDLVETWPDPGDAGSLRVTISARKVKALGLVLSRRGDRWAVPPGRPGP